MPARIQKSAECVFIIILAVSPYSVALSQPSGELFDKKFSVSAGAFITDHDTNIRLDSDYLLNRLRLPWDHMRGMTLQEIVRIRRSMLDVLSESEWVQVFG